MILMAKFNPVITTEKHGSVNISWFPKEFSQSRLGGKITGGSNACTLIAILVTQKCYQNSIKVDSSEELVSQDLINALGESILQGNHIHKQLSQSGALLHVNLTVPEAIVAAGPRVKFISEWKSFIYLLDLRGTLYTQLRESVREWYRNPPPMRGSDLFVILIAENRSVVLVFHSETNSVTLMDLSDASASVILTLERQNGANLDARIGKSMYKSRPKKDSSDAADDSAQPRFLDGSYTLISLSSRPNLHHSDAQASKLLTHLRPKGPSGLGVIQNSGVALIDSHSHANYGAVVACCAMPQLRDLCTWYSDTIVRCYGAEPSCYELTFLYFRKLDSGEGAHNP